MKHSLNYIQGIPFENSKAEYNVLQNFRQRKEYNAIDNFSNLLLIRKFNAIRNLKLSIIRRHCHQ